MLLAEYLQRTTLTGVLCMYWSHCKLLVFRSQAVGPSVNQVITLVSSTGFQASAKKPPAGMLPVAELNGFRAVLRHVHCACQVLLTVQYIAGYPEAYFARLTLPQEAVMAVIAACRSDDIYHQASW